jgi:hypothetical protein
VIARLIARRHRASSPDNASIGYSGGGVD